MKDFSFYEQVGIILPGSALLAGAAIVFPELRPILAGKDFTVGDLGLFVIFSYISGHMLAGVGNFIERIFWWPFGGMPSMWPLNKDSKLLNSDQRKLLEQQVEQRLKIPISLSDCDKDKWRTIFRQLYVDVVGADTPKRIEAFNGNYGLNRGLATSALMTSVSLLIFDNKLPHWLPYLSLIVAISFTYRAYRFGVYFASEVYLRFLNKTEQTSGEEDVGAEKE